MFSKGFSYIRCDNMVSDEKEAGDFLLDLMDSERVSQYNSNLQQRNMMVIKWLEAHVAQAEMIAQNEGDSLKFCVFIAFSGKRAIMKLLGIE